MKHRITSTRMSTRENGAASSETTSSKPKVQRPHVITKSLGSQSFDLLQPQIPADQQDHNDFWNYALLLVLYTLQGIPMGLSASIPFLIQQKIKTMASAAAAVAPAAAASATSGAASAAAVSSAASRLSYNANAIFALCSWPFSLKLLWAPIVDAVFFKQFGRRKSWLVPVQAIAGFIMVSGANFVERNLGLGQMAAMDGAELARKLEAAEALPNMNVKGVTIFFFCLYFLMATQDVAVDGWALTMLSRKNRFRGPLCNSIGQNIGYFLSFVGFLALNDAESSEKLWRPLFGLKSKPGEGLISLGGFIRCMGYIMLTVTTLVALFKREVPPPSTKPPDSTGLVPILFNKKKPDDNDELDASELGIRETYHRLWAVCQLPAVRWLFVILLTYRLPTALADNVKFLKAVEYGLSKSTTALLSPTLILPLGILVPILAHKSRHSSDPLRQFMAAYKVRVTLVPILDILMLLVIRRRGQGSTLSDASIFWVTVVASTAMQAIVNSLQFNAQMTFFASRVDPAIGGTYITLLNTAANLGGTYPASFSLWAISKLTRDPVCKPSSVGGGEICSGGRDPYVLLQAFFSTLGCLWILFFGKRVERIASLPESAWRTHILDEDIESEDIEVGSGWTLRDSKRQ